MELKNEGVIEDIKKALTENEKGKGRVSFSSSTTGKKCIHFLTYVEKRK